MNYFWSFAHIPFEDIHVAFEIGSRDLYDAFNIANVYECKLIAFECNPECIEVCKETQKTYPNPNVQLIEKAVTDVDGEITFYAFDTTKYDNMGASSVFEIDFVTNRPNEGDDYGKKDVQVSITVPSIRLDTFCKEHTIVPDAIFMDVQEAELKVLRSAGQYLSKIKYIVTEVSTCPTYKGGCDIVELDAFLEENGFVLVSHTKEIVQRTQTWSSMDVVYKNTRL